MPEEMIATAESTAVSKFVNPVINAVFKLPATITTAEQYTAAGDLLVLCRKNRRDLTTYFKEAPKGKPGPGEGLCYFAHQAWQSTLSLFNRLDGQFQKLDAEINQAMTGYRRQLEAQAKAAADAERKRLEEEAARKRQEAIAAQRKATTANEMAAAQLDELDAVEMAEAPPPPPAPIVVPQVDKLKIKKVWRGRVLDVRALCADIGSGEAPLGLVKIVESELHKLADLQVGRNAPAGVEFYEEEVTRGTR